MKQSWPVWTIMQRRFHGMHMGETRVESKRLVLHQCGCVGCRVGEASNHGPVQTRSAKLRTTQLDSDPEVVTGGRHAVLSGDSSEDDGPTTWACSSAVSRGRDIRIDSVCREGSVRNVRKRLRLSQASTVVAPPESVVDALEADLSHLFQDDLDTDATIEHELEAVHNSVGDAGDGTGLAVVERAVDAESHDCVGVAQFAEAQARRPSRRLVLVETQHDGRAEPDSDTDSVVCALEDDHGEDPAEEDDRESVVSGEQSVGSVEEEAMPFRLPGLRATQTAFRALDDVNLTAAFEKRACLMHRVPRFLRGLFRCALHVGLEEISEGCRVSDTRRQERGWKLFMLLPRMLLHRPPRGGMISRAQLISRFEMFVKGEWTALIKAGEACATQAGGCTTTQKTERRRFGSAALQS